MTFSFMLQPSGATRLGDVLLQAFCDEQWTEFRAAVAFVKRSGTKHLCAPLTSFARRGGRIRMSAGVDAGGTSREGLEDLLAALDGHGELFVFKNGNSSTFHPKVYLFKSATAARLAVGSGNLTEGGLFTNYEAGLLLDLQLADPAHASLLAEIEAGLDAWSTPVSGSCYRLDHALLTRLSNDGWVPEEAYSRGGDRAGTTGTSNAGTPLFASFPVPRAPVVPVQASAPPNGQQSGAVSSSPAANAPQPTGTPASAGNVAPQNTFSPAAPSPIPAGTVFLMTLQNTDVGVGQTRPGTQRRSAEVFIPLVCRDHDPAFWGWSSLFTPDPNYTGKRDAMGRGKMDRPGVRLRIGGDIVSATIWYNSDKKDIRIRSEDLRSSGNVGDILYMEQSADPDFDYYVDVIPQGTSRHGQYLAQCVNTVRNSLKRWAYV